MIRIWFVLISLLVSSLVEAQIDEIKTGLFDGVWVAEDYYKSLISTKSPLGSKDAFDSHGHVALRIKHNSISNQQLLIGYSRLHSHLIHPEIEGCGKSIVFDSCEQGYFYINLKQNDKGFRMLADNFFEYDSTRFLLFYQTKKPKLKMLIKHDEGVQKVEFHRIDFDFQEDYPFPNPIKLFINTELLAGKYNLIDFRTKIKSTVEITQAGRIIGCSFCDSGYTTISTDQYCGGTPFDIFISSSIRAHKDREFNGYGLKPDSDGGFYLYDYRWIENEPPTLPTYELTDRLFYFQRILED